ncbi:hypothetical protein SANTM175S_06896 [Streptomyces antimycoticus]
MTTVQGCPAGLSPPRPLPQLGLRPQTPGSRGGVLPRGEAACRCGGKGRGGEQPAAGVRIRRTSRGARQPGLRAPAAGDRGARGAGRGGGRPRAHSLSLALPAFPPRERATAVGVWTAVSAVAASAVAASAGPVAGGLLAASDWRRGQSPAVLLAWPAGLRLLPRTGPVRTGPVPTGPVYGERRRLDPLGTLLVLLGTGCLTTACVEAADRGCGAPGHPRLPRRRPGHGRAGRGARTPPSGSGGGPRAVPDPCLHRRHARAAQLLPRLRRPDPRRHPAVHRGMGPVLGPSGPFRHTLAAHRPGGVDAVGPDRPGTGAAHHGRGRRAVLRRGAGVVAAPRGRRRCPLRRGVHTRSGAHRGRRGAYQR